MCVGMGWREGLGSPEGCRAGGWVLTPVRTRKASSQTSPSLRWLCPWKEKENVTYILSAIHCQALEATGTLKPGLGASRVEDGELGPSPGNLGFLVSCISCVTKDSWPFLSEFSDSSIR
jgi:hypothetical protein